MDKKLNEFDFNRDTEYWNGYYSKNLAVTTPSPFALFVYENYLTKNSTLLELGCGNGRDSLFFHSNGIKITAVDASNVAINELQKLRLPDANFICGNFVDSKIIYSQKYNFCYARFSLHAITEAQENILLNNVAQVLNQDKTGGGGKFFIEVRSVNDELYGKGEPVGKNSFIYNSHFRRFIDKKELENNLIAKNFRIDYSEESSEFAPFGNDKPSVIRVIAQI